jgi:acetoin utilization deacetylase AcuC-like enzyme
LQKKHGLKKIAIVDYDIHHGNGTQDIFFDDGSVFYMSVHRFPFYPGSGSEDETGLNAGQGATLNFPLYHGAGEHEYLDALETGLRKGVVPFAPDFILISAGFDAYEYDPLGGLGVTVNGFHKATELIVQTAQKVCGGKIVSALEGGYNTKELPLCIAAHLKALLHV